MITSDLGEFERLAAIGYDDLKRGCYDAASARLSEALALWRGTALTGATEFLADAEQPRFTEFKMAALEGRVEADLALGKHDQLVLELNDLVERFPLRERIRAQLMTALYCCGRQADALEVYRRGRELLAEHLGVDPSAMLNNVFQSILNGELTLEVPGAPTRKLNVTSRTAERPALLPPDLADFTGRESHLRRLFAEMRSEGRGPLAISGMVGTGKSSLAVHLANQCLPDFPDGHLYVNMKGGDDLFQVLGKFIEALGLDGELPQSLEERTQLYRAKLADRRMLILIDNAQNESQARMLLPSIGRARGIVTSRVRLAVLDGARRVDLGPFERAEALELLGKVIGPGRVGAETVAAERLVELCEHLPLAVRIAAARLAARPHWSLARLLRRMSDGSQSRLDELRISNLDLRAALKQNYDPLPATKKAALQRLALLGTYTIPVWAAAAALNVPEREAEDLLEELVDARVISVGGPDREGRFRYRLPELFLLLLMEQGEREYAKAEQTAVHTRVLQTCVSRMRVAGVGERRALATLTGAGPPIPSDALPTAEPTSDNGEGLSFASVQRWMAESSSRISTSRLASLWEFCLQIAAYIDGQGI
ncbi:hypothetical protein HNR23_004332 [Nocardiopsis mwathae]|uniref:Bacterial transcriptional activator domain-containing protein n=1 Tax=Nocardiopsis mwathae TaxID=1472723 RepID=A0A7X0D754_9ACTN|nr:hypothetical protein [Nocardiopsis mwathae]